MDLVSPEIFNLLYKKRCLVVSCGFESCMSLFESGEVMTWGYGGSGVLGHGDYETQLDPKKVESLNDIVFVQAGGYHNGAIDKDGKVFMWGRGDVG